MSEKISRKTFRIRLEEMIRTLREQVLSGEYAIGEYLPSELDLSIKFQLSNNSVRKGLDILVEEGLIEKIPRIGNRIKEPDEDTQIVLRFGCYSTMYSQADLTFLLSEFQRRHPHIRIQTITIDNTFENVLNYLDNDLIDIFTINHYMYEEFVENKALDVLEAQESNEEIYPYLQQVFCRDDVVYAQPLVFSPVILCYNRQHFTELQIPEPDSSWSWDDLLHYSSQLAIKNERFGFFFHLINVNRWIIFLIQSGEAFLQDENGQYRIEGTRLLDGIEKVREILHTPDAYPLMLSTSDTDAERLFREENVSIIMSTYFALDELKGIDFEFDVAPLPHLNDYSTLLVTVGLAINKRSKVKAGAAKQLVDFLVSDEAQQVIRDKTYSIPANKKAAQWTSKTKLARPTRYQMYREIMPTFRMFTDTNLSLKQLRDVLSECKLYWAGLKSKEKLVISLEQVLNKKIG